MTKELEEKLSQLGEVINFASDTGDISKLDFAISECNEILAEEAANGFRGIIHYFLGNAWSGKRHILYTGQSGLRWEQPELESEIWNFRKSLSYAIAEDMHDVHVCQCLTNLGNALSYVGRPIEAVEYWSQAAQAILDFPMAIGNRGYGLEHYAILLHDMGHKQLFLKKAHSDLSVALQYHLEGSAAVGFQDAVGRIESFLPLEFLESEVDLDRFSLGETEEEVLYRQWCLKQRLFLNPLNDLGEHSIAATDVMHLPSIVVRINEGPYYGGFFNQMKQEFVSARFLLFEGITANDTHYSDRDVTIINTLDYPIYSLAIEKVKIAFRISYSLFDKIALFINHYLELGLPDKSVSFKTIWYERRQKDKGIRSDIEDLLNNSLRGLYWLSKDLIEKRSNFIEVMEHDSQEIELLRQHAEHRYLKVHDFLFDMESEGGTIPTSLSDTLARSVSRAGFEKKAVKTMHLARNALIYLCLVIKREEDRRQQERPADSVVMPMILRTWEDDWKV